MCQESVYLFLQAKAEAERDGQRYDMIQSKGSKCRDLLHQIIDDVDSGHMATLLLLAESYAEGIGVQQF